MCWLKSNELWQKLEYFLLRLSYWLVNMIQSLVTNDERTVRGKVKHLGLSVMQLRDGLILTNIDKASALLCISMENINVKNGALEISGFTLQAKETISFSI